MLSAGSQIKPIQPQHFLFKADHGHETHPSGPLQFNGANLQKTLDKGLMVKS